MPEALSACPAVGLAGRLLSGSSGGGCVAPWSRPSRCAAIRVTITRTSVCLAGYRSASLSTTPTRVSKRTSGIIAAGKHATACAETFT